MKNLALAFALGLMMLAPAREVAAQATASAMGTWDYQIDTGQDVRQGTLTLADSSGTLSGAINEDDGQTMALENPELVGDTLTFGFTTNGYGAGTGEVVFAEDAFSGQLNLPSYGTFPIEGTRQAAEEEVVEEETVEEDTAEEEVEEEETIEEETEEVVEEETEEEETVEEESTSEEAAASVEYSTQTPLRQLFESEEAKAVVEEHVPGLTSDPRLDQAMDMSLRDIAPYAPETFTEEVLQAIDDDLSDLE